MVLVKSRGAIQQRKPLAALPLHIATAGPHSWSGFDLHNRNGPNGPDLRKAYTYGPVGFWILNFVSFSILSPLQKIIFLNTGLLLGRVRSRPNAPHPSDSRVVWQEVSATSSVSALKDDAYQKKASASNKVISGMKYLLVTYRFFFFFGLQPPLCLSCRYFFSTQA